jgi:UDP-4-amino-4,6-dideoxy-N-acetyl-beta-L-altrosamine transaminase/dTDP-4-dehydrorhamnose reductase
LLGIGRPITYLRAMASKRRKVVISGGTGLLASNIALYKREDWEILLLTRNNTSVCEGVVTAKANLMDSLATLRLIESFEPDLVINAAGLANVEECERNYYKAHLANVVVSKNLARLCSDLKVKLVHISTDHFAKQDVEVSTEEDISMPLNVYAETKFLGESAVARICPDALIVRTNFFGWGHESRTSFSDFIIGNLRKSNSITLFDDIYYSPIFVDELTDSIEALIEKNESGIFNVVTNRKISKYEFGLKAAEIFNLDTSLIHKGAMAHVPMTRRPSNMALDNQKMVRALGEKFNFDFVSSLKKLKDVEFEGRRKKLIESIKNPMESRKPQISYGRQLLDEDDVNSVITTLLSPVLTQGPKVEEFEDKIANYVGAKYAVSFANLTCGLHAANIAMGIGPGDYMITSPLTFVATSNAALFCGAIPLFADIDPMTLNIDPAKVEELLQKYGKKVKAIVPVHFAGHPCDMKRLNELASRYNVQLIEDAAHAIGGEYMDGGKIGNGKRALMAGFSFHPVKNITTGEGAALTTNDVEIYKELCRIRSHGITKGNDPFIHRDMAYTKGSQNTWYYEMQSLGYNYRLTDMQSSLGISQMSKLDHFMEIRRKYSAIYDSELGKLPFVRLLQRETRNISGNHLYTVRLDFKALKISRNELFEKFRNHGVFLHVHYIPVFLQPFYQKIEGNDLAMKCQNTLDYYEEAVTLPLYPKLSERDVQFVVQLFENLASI